MAEEITTGFVTFILAFNLKADSTCIPMNKSYRMFQPQCYISGEREGRSWGSPASGTYNVCGKQESQKNIEPWNQILCTNFAQIYT